MRFLFFSILLFSSTVFAFQKITCEVRSGINFERYAKIEIEKELLLISLVRTDGTIEQVITTSKVTDGYGNLETDRQSCSIVIKSDEVGFSDSDISCRSSTIKLNLFIDDVDPDLSSGSLDIWSHIFFSDPYLVSRIRFHKCK